MAHPINKEKKRVQEQIFYNLMRLVEEYPQYSISQHLVHILRTKGDSQDNYFWDDAKLLKKFEDYRDELDKELKIQKEEANGVTTLSNE